MSGRQGPRVVLVMGPAGVGKTTVGLALAERLGAAFVEADDLHPPANVARMRRGEPLDDAARAPWLRAVRAAVEDVLRSGARVVVACSALKAEYRETLLDGLGDAAVVHLRADRATLASRVGGRPGHFMPASLIESQLADLEAPAADEAIVVDATDDPDTIVARLVEALTGAPKNARSTSRPDGS